LKLTSSASFNVGQHKYFAWCNLQFSCDTKCWGKNCSVYYRINSCLNLTESRTQKHIPEFKTDQFTHYGKQTDS